MDNTPESRISTNTEVYKSCENNTHKKQTQINLANTCETLLQTG